jgi:formate hydrogenlyase subunit 3/multisubunit Na+/H+ antiporter MnhD subunit
MEAILNNTLNLFAFNSFTVLPSFFIFIVSVFASFYNSLFTKNKIRTATIFITYFASIVAILSKNFIVTFIGLELLSLCAFGLVLLANRVQRRVAISYLLVHSLAGIFMFVFIVLNYSQNNTFTISPLKGVLDFKETLLLLAFIINTASIPFFGWYTRTYLRVDAFSLIMLATITTKTSFFVFWRLFPQVSILFEVGLITLIIASVGALLTKNVIKFLLFTSIASMGFSVVSVSFGDFGGFTAVNGIREQVSFQLIWYIASGIFATSGFLVLYGYITHYECKTYSFASITNYFKTHGSSLHFVLLAMVFGLYLSAFPLSTAFIAKTNIAKFFVEDRTIYYTIKASSIIFVLFAIRLVLPVWHSIEFFKLDKNGGKLIAILYLIALTLIGINAFFLFTSDVKYGLFYFSVEFFTFLVYFMIAGILLVLLSLMIQKIKVKSLVLGFVEFKRLCRLKFINFIYFSAVQVDSFKKLLLRKSEIKKIISVVVPSLSGLIFVVLVLITTFLYKI